MRGITGIAGAAVLFGLAAALTLISQAPASGSPQGAQAAPQDATEPVPAFHAQAPKGGVAETMSPDFFTEPMVRNAYAVAAKIRRTLYQQPCYCHCDRSQGHTSLLDCFAGQHGAGCGTCIYEDFYAYEQVRRGKTAAQIREGIIKGEWKSVNAAKYQQPLPAK